MLQMLSHPCSSLLLATLSEFYALLVLAVVLHHPEEKSQATLIFERGGCFPFSSDKSTYLQVPINCFDELR